MNVIMIAGARPNFMKIAPIYREAEERNELNCRIVHTGQHYDFEMSDTFFQDLEIPEPDYFLRAGSGSHAVQTAKIMIEFEKLCQKEIPDLVMVVGDVNSTLACSVVAKKLSIKVAHIEAGLRSFDMEMPEEINRMVTDSISDYFFVTEESGVENLKREGKLSQHIHFVGNVMIDNLFHQLERLKLIGDEKINKYQIEKKSNYYFLTLHRPSNVDRKETLSEIVDTLSEIAETHPIIFPVHPRTRSSIERYHIKFSKNIHLLQPMSFKEALYIWKDAALVLTDSGGLQEETTALGVPCLTLRENTERPITIEKGSNLLAGTQRDSIISAYHKSMDRKRNQFTVPAKWDGRAAQRIWDVILNSNDKK